MGDITVNSFDGCSLVVRIEGHSDGVPVLLSHSLGATMDIWENTAGALLERFRVIRYDSRGHGRSEAPPGPYNVAMLARDALAVLDSLHIDRTHFVGLSQGAMAGMQLAANAGQRIDRLVLANTTAFIPAKEPFNVLIERAAREGLSAIAETTILGWLGARFKQSHPEKTAALVESMRRMSPAGYAGACGALRDVDLRGDLERIAAPTLVISGIEDGERGAAAATALVKGIKGAQRLDLPDAVHLTPIECPLLFNRAVLEFLA